MKLEGPPQTRAECLTLGFQLLDLQGGVRPSVKEPSVGDVLLQLYIPI